MIDASIVIPTFNRAHQLDLTLASVVRSIQNQKSNIEVIISDDGSSDGTFAEVVRKYERKCHLRFVYAPDDGFQAARARNLGAAVARGKILIFCDSGMVMQPDFVACHLDAHNKKNDQYLIGLVYGIYDQKSKHLTLSEKFSQIHEERDFMSIVAKYELNDPRLDIFESCKFDLSLLKAPWALAWTANVSLPLSLFHRAGGFDENYQSWGCEDLDFALAITRVGGKIGVAMNAAGIHAPHDEQKNSELSNSQNKAYLHQKYGLHETELLLTMSTTDLNKL